VAAHGAELVVLGGKHQHDYRALVRREHQRRCGADGFGAGAGNVGAPAIRRVLLAWIPSAAARPAVAAAERYALFGASCGPSAWLAA